MAGLNSLYDELGVARDATKEDIKKAYRKRARETHPDAGGTVDKFGAIQKAYTVLSDDVRRDKYDRTGDIEEQTADNIEATALNGAMAAVEQVLNSLESMNRDPSGIDVIKQAIDFLNMNIRNGESALTALQGRIAKRKAVAKRFKSKRGKKNMIRPLIAGQIAVLERQTESMRQQLVPIRRSVEILSDHSFECDPDKPPTSYFVQFNNFASQ